MNEDRSVRAPPAVGTLDLLRPGMSGVIGAPGALNPTILRLLEMGMTAGAEVAVTRRAPGGDPMEIRVRGTRLCVRSADAACFPVRRDPTRSPRSDE